MLWFIYRYILKTKNTWKFKIAVKLKDEALINVINFPETAQEDSHWLLARKTETACVFLCYKEHTNVKIICKYSDNTYLKAQTSHTWGSRLPRKCLKGNRNNFVFSLSLFFFSLMKNFLTHWKYKAIPVHEGLLILVYHPNDLSFWVE